MTDYQSIISDKPLTRDFGKDVDTFINIREGAKIDLVKSRMALLNAGAKTAKDGSLNSLPGLDVDKFIEYGNQEFSWLAEYKDGSVMKQYEGKKQNHYGRIDLSKLKKFSWVSCFLDSTDNNDKRVIVTLDFETGKFDFLNGFVPQDVRAEVIDGYPQGFSPKLIMKIVRRVSTSLSYPNGNVDEVTYYNRYLIGWKGSKESPVTGKRVLCIEPNGFTHLWHES